MKRMADICCLMHTDSEIRYHIAHQIGGFLECCVLI